MARWTAAARGTGPATCGEELAVGSGTRGSPSSSCRSASSDVVGHLHVYSSHTHAA